MLSVPLRRLKNIYDPASPEDSLRLLVMRKWPRGVSLQQQLLAALLGLTAKGNITLLCGCRDEAHCHRTLLKRIIEWVDHSFSFGPGGEPPAGGK